MGIFPHRVNQWNQPETTWDLDPVDHIPSEKDPTGPSGIPIPHPICVDIGNSIYSDINFDDHSPYPPLQKYMGIKNPTLSQPPP